MLIAFFLVSGVQIGRGSNLFYKSNIKGENCIQQN